MNLHQCLQLKKRTDERIRMARKLGNSHPRFLIYLDMCLSYMVAGTILSDYFDLEIWKFRYAHRRRYVTARRHMQLQRCNESSAMHFRVDKGDFNRRFGAYLHRRWLDMTLTSEDAFQEFVQSVGETFIVKPRDLLCGEGVYKKHVDQAQLHTDFEQLKADKAIVEEILVQDNTLALFNPYSVNTIRVMTIPQDEGAGVVAASLRLGVGKTVVDNFCAGGIAAEVDPKFGVVISAAQNQNNEKFYVHPKSGKQIIGFQIPQWSEICRICVEAANSIPQLPYIGWDVCITQEGQIAFVEGNEAPMPSLYQMLDGKWDIFKHLLQK